MTCSFPSSRDQRVSVRWYFCVLLTLLLGSANLAMADISLPAVFSDQMVLQREIPASVWGKAAPGEKITVSLHDQSQSAEAGPDGAWSVILRPLAAGGPYTLTVRGAATTKTFKDVLVGEVWFGSGQSNMAWGLRAFREDAPLMAAAAAVPANLRICSARGKGWSKPDAKSLQGFSAQLFYFGTLLQKELGVPVGLIVGAVSGSPSGQWLDATMFSASPECVAAAAKADAAYDPAKAAEEYAKSRAKWEKAAAKARAAGKKEPRAPSLRGHPQETRKRQLGRHYDVHVKPIVGFALRGILWDQGESGTALDGISQAAVMRALISGWRKAWGMGDIPFLVVQKPSGGGCAWDPQNPVTRCAEAFAKLPAQAPAPTARIGDALELMAVPRVALVSTSDLGGGIHPENKSGYATRAAQVAMGFVYQKPVAWIGPVYDSHQVDGPNLRITFRHVGSGLSPKHSESVQGFALAGADGKYHWAEARIEGDSVVIHTSAVATPQAAYYAWDSRRPWANLFNRDGLPAQPFRLSLH